MKNRKSSIEKPNVQKRLSNLKSQQNNHNLSKKQYSQETNTRRQTEKLIKFPSVKNYKAHDDQKYILNQIIGQGAFAKVRIGYRKCDSLPCVIKSYQKFRISSQQKRNSVNKQISILKNIQHPSIIKIIDSYQSLDSINIVMEHFSNRSLAIFAKQNRPIEEEILKNITKSIAQALVYLHENKISHRDLKPQNILINSQGLAMMGDHESMIVAGTPQFMCPELVHKKKYNPYKADIWAFGILLYWIFLGYYPQDNCKKTKNSKVPSFTLKFPVDMHPGVQYLIQKMLQIDPQIRIDAKQILEDSWIRPRNIKFEISKLIKSGIV